MGAPDDAVQTFTDGVANVLKGIVAESYRTMTSGTYGHRAAESHGGLPAS